MGFWSRLLGREQKASSLDLLRSLTTGTRSKSGREVNIDTALQTSAVLACVRCLADGVAQVPLKIFRADSSTGSRRPAPDHPLYAVLHSKPNDYQTSFEFRETLMMHATLAGDFYAFINRVNGRVVELVPMDPSKVKVVWDADAQAKRFEFRATSGALETYAAGDIWHVKGPSWDSIKGLGAVQLAKEAIGLSIATEESHSRMHKNGARPGGAVSVSGRLTEEQHAKLQNWIAENYAGAENAYSTMILDRDAKFTPYTVSGVDSQHLETRRFQIEEVCRAFRVMPIMAGYSDKASTYASAEQMFLAHVVYTLSPWYERIEQSIAAQLLSEEDLAAGFYPKFIANGLLRGAAADRAEFYSKALGSGGSPAWLTPNEIRELEELNPIEGGDKLPVSTNPAPTTPANAGA